MTHISHATNSVWQEFTKSICDQLNEGSFIAVVADSPIANAVTTLVDEIVSNSSRDGDHGSICSMPCFRLRVMFTDKDSQKKIQNCLALHGRAPFLAIVDNSDEDDEHSFVLDINPLPPSSPTSTLYKGGAGDSKISNNITSSMMTTISNGNSIHNNNNNNNNNADFIIDDSLRDRLLDFLTRVSKGEEARAQQGAAPTVGDVFAPTHGVVLSEGCSAVTCTWQRLRRASAKRGGGGGGAICVFWSDRCHCCPGALRTIDVLVGVIRHIACRYCCGGPCTTCQSSSDHFLFPYIVCNIDDNEFPKEDWPICANEEQVVPRIVAYTHSGELRRVVYDKSRTCVDMMRFMLDNCLSPTAASYDGICADAMTVAKALDRDIDGIMRVFPEHGDSFKAAAAAVSTAKALEDIHKIQAACRKASYELFDLPREVDKILDDAAAAAADTSKKHLDLTTADSPVPPPPSEHLNTSCTIRIGGGEKRSRDE